jgi:hypothetical protein
MGAATGLRRRALLRQAHRHGPARASPFRLRCCTELVTRLGKDLVRHICEVGRMSADERDNGHSWGISNFLGWPYRKKREGLLKRRQQPFAKGREL